MSKRFADTFFFLALIDKNDRHHERVVAFANADDSLIVTTRWILAETANALAASADRAGVADFLRELENDPHVEIVGESDDLFARGLDLYANRPDKQWSLTDCISFVVMEAHGLREALTGDRHLAQAGFTAVFQ